LINLSKTQLRKHASRHGRAQVTGHTHGPTGRSELRVMTTAQRQQCCARVRQSAQAGVRTTACILHRRSVTPIAARLQLTIVATLSAPSLPLNERHHVLRREFGKLFRLFGGQHVARFRAAVRESILSGAPGHMGNFPVEVAL
jgi:hypothetical protein